VPRFIVKLAEDKFVQWSTICDAPVSSVMSEAECRAHLENEIQSSVGVHASSQKLQASQRALFEEQLQERWARIEEYGTSAYDGTTAEDLVSGNRAGVREARLTTEEIIELYTWSEEKKGKFPFT
jgi:hypothetical protein